jgi:hypothetical protein
MFWAAIGLAVGMVFNLPAQEVGNTAQLETTSLTASDIAQLPALSDKDLAAFLNALSATPTIAPENAPGTGNFYSLRHPDYAPSPGNVLNQPVWPMSGWNADSGNFLLDDLEPGDPGDGDGTNYFQSDFHPLIFTTNDLWLSITGMTNTTAHLVIHPPWSDTNLTHDLLYTTSLNSPINWHFLLRCISTNVTVSELCRNQGFFALTQTNGNLTVSTNSTAQQLAQLLVPPWVVVTNATYTGAIEARGTFAGGNGCGLPMDTGVILATGDITNAIGPNNLSVATTEFYADTGILYSDSDLNSLLGGRLTADSAVLEFDIVSTNSFVLQFYYIFASEEYPEYIGKYNDPMAIFVSTNRMGTNWINSITNDFALVPGTTNVPVTVNTINGGYDNEYVNIWPINSQYYVDNHDPGNSSVTNAAPAQEFNIQYDGMTVQLSAKTFISANITNHVKIAIADYYGDDAYDSAVSLKAWSACQCQ